MSDKMRWKYILFLTLLSVIASTSCSVYTKQMASADNLQTKVQTREQTSTSENANSPTQTVQVQATKESAAIAADVNSATPTVQEQATKESDAKVEDVKDNRMKLQIGESVFTAILVENSTTDALKEMLSKGPITIKMRDYGSMEKVGSFGTDLPRNDEQITTEAGDLILYQGNAFVIYYAPNSWNFTRIGKIDGVAQEELKKVLGSGEVTVTLSLD